MTGEEGGAAPAPTRSLADNTDDRTPPAQSPAGTPDGTAATGEADGSVAAGSINMTEFAALDTDSNGMLAEQEWQNKPVEGIEFSDLDQDGSGNVDREEFRQAAAATGGETSEVDPASLDPTRSTTE
jgi:hypothetical protein